MTKTQAIVATLLAYNVVLITIGLWASRRTHDNEDFFLGGRRLGGWVAALSASASSSSAWTLLGVSGAAYAWGISALWLFPATLSGFAINWLWVGPRLMEQSRASRSVTLTEFLAGDPNHPLFRAVMRLSSVVIVFSFVFYIASQFQAAGHAFESALGTSMLVSTAIGVTIIVLYTLMGGFWAVSVTDVIQGLTMAACAVIVPVAALRAVGGPGALADGLRAVSSTQQLQITGSFSGVMGIAFVLGTLGIGLGYPGQPHVVNRFMAIRDPQALRVGRSVSLVWAVIIYSGMLLTGLCARVLFPAFSNSEQILFEAANQLLPAVVAGIVIAAVLSAIMSTADSQLLVATSSLSYDLQRGRGKSRKGGAGAAGSAGSGLRSAGSGLRSGEKDAGSGLLHPASEAGPGLLHSRIIVVAISFVAMLIGILAPAEIFSRVLFAWTALGSAFGPPLILRLAGRRPGTGATLAAIATGFGATIVANWAFPTAPGDWVERLVPFFLALGVSWMGRAKPESE